MSDTNAYFAERSPNYETHLRFDRLKRAVDGAGGNAAVAEKAGVGTTTVSTYMNGKEWKLGIVEKIANACQVDLRWVLFGDEAANKDKNPQTLESVNENNRISIRLYNAEASAGYGMQPANVEDYAYIDLLRSSLPPHVISRLKHLIGVTVRGDSMQPTLYDSDTIFVDTGDTDVIPGCVYVLRRDHDLMVKRLAWTIMGDLVVSSDNSRYPSETINAERARALFEAGGAPVQVVGRVLYKIGTIGSL